MRKYIKLLRVKHYVKNLLLFVPLFFSQNFFDIQRVLHVLVGAIGFCFISSAVYILNDLKDIEKDRQHPVKKNRPLANGSIEKKTAIIIFIVCLVLSLSFALLSKYIGVLYIMGYFLLNILYSLGGLKNKPLIDVVILASGFVIRVLFGAQLADVAISGWLYLVVIAGALFMGLGKRRNELQVSGDTREVLKYYTYSFLDKNMYVCLSLLNVFYALWAVESENVKMRWTIPLVLIIVMKYSLNIETESDGDPVEVLLHDKMLIGLVAVYIISLFGLLYLI